MQKGVEGIHPPPNAMTPERQREVIAEILGWNIACKNDWKWRKSPSMREPTGSFNGAFPMILPDFLNDLNECAKMEGSLSGGNQEPYVTNLRRLILPQRLTWHLVNATAAQRCEAFLRTHGKFEGTTKE